MPSDRCLLTYEEKTIVAVFYQRQERKDYGMKFRSNWVFQEDFSSYELVTQYYNLDEYIFVKEEDEAICLSDYMRNTGLSDLTPSSLLKRRPYLKWEPCFHPDDHAYYPYHCIICGEGIPCKDKECLACGFAEEMVCNEFIEDNRKIIEDHYRFLSFFA